MYLQPFLGAQWELCCGYLLVCFNSCWLKLKKIYCHDLQKYYRLLVLHWVIRGNLSEAQHVLVAVVCQGKTRSLQYADNKCEWIYRFLRYKSCLFWTWFLNFLCDFSGLAKGTEDSGFTFVNVGDFQLVPSSDSLLSQAVQIQVFSTIVNYLWELTWQKNNSGKKAKSIRASTDQSMYPVV